MSDKEIVTDAKLSQPNLPVHSRRGLRPRPPRPARKPLVFNPNTEKMQTVYRPEEQIERPPPNKRHKEILIFPPKSGAKPIPGIIKRSPTIPGMRDAIPETSPTASTSEQDFSRIKPFISKGIKPSALSNEIRLPETINADDLVDIFPHQITCKLLTKFNGKSQPLKHRARCAKCRQHNLQSDECPECTAVIKGFMQFPGFKWFEIESYDKLKAKCKRKVETFKSRLTSDRPHGLFRVYLRHGSCSVVGTTDLSRYDPDTSSFESDAEDEAGISRMHEVAIKQVCKFIATYPNQKFTLVIYCDYGSIQEEPIKGSFKDMMILQYDEKLKIPPTTFRGQNYISRADINALTTQKISDSLIDEAEDCGNEREKSTLKLAVASQVAQTLLAVCVCERIDFKQFKHFLLDHKFSDANFEWSDGDCHDPKRCEIEYKKLKAGMHKFFGHVIEEDRWFHVHEPDEVVPVSLATSRKIGEGSFSEVFEVFIDVTHRTGQSLSSDLSKAYALKVFNQSNFTGTHRFNAFRREIRMLLYLAVYPHPHILTHITSWEQGQEFYILYEKARSNLRKYIEVPNSEGLTKARILWFLHQLHGLAGAVQKVHQLKEESKTDKSPILTPSKCQGRKRRLAPAFDDAGDDQACAPNKPKKTGIVGYHHDIKPENILVFDRSGYYPLLKLSDFGAGKFSLVREKQSAQATEGLHGTPTYRGPEFAMGMKATRPYDMWALGCVFLEFLLWFLNLEQPIDGKSFSTLRQEESNDSNAQLDYFWQIRDWKAMPSQQHQKSESQPANMYSTAIKGGRRSYTPSGNTLRPDVAGRFMLNRAVTKVLNNLEYQWCKDMVAFVNVIKQIRDLLNIKPAERTTAVNLTSALDAILSQTHVDLGLAEANGENFYSEIYRRNQNLSKGIPPSHRDEDGFMSEEPELPKQLAVVQPPGADIPTIGTSRRRSLEQLRAEDSKFNTAYHGHKHLAEQADHAMIGSNFSSIPPSNQLSPLRLASEEESPASDVGFRASLRPELSDPYQAFLRSKVPSSTNNRPTRPP